MDAYRRLSKLVKDYIEAQENLDDFNDRHPNYDAYDEIMKMEWCGKFDERNMSKDRLLRFMNSMEMDFDTSIQ